MLSSPRGDRHCCRYPDAPWRPDCSLSRKPKASLRSKSRTRGLRLFGQGRPEGRWLLGEHCNGQLHCHFVRINRSTYDMVKWLRYKCDVMFKNVFERGCLWSYIHMYGSESEGPRDEIMSADWVHTSNKVVKMRSLYCPRLILLTN